LTLLLNSDKIRTIIYLLARHLIQSDGGNWPDEVRQPIIMVWCQFQRDSRKIRDFDYLNSIF
jgi:hypothetical protein